jgi:glutathione peroxidase-family protein
VELVSFPQLAQTNVLDVQEMNLKEAQGTILVVVDIATNPFFNNSYELEHVKRGHYHFNLEKL